MFVASSKKGNNQASQFYVSLSYFYFSNSLFTYMLLFFFCAYISLSCCKHCPTVGYTKLNHLMDLWFSWLRSLGLSALLAAILFSLLLSFTVISTWLVPATGQMCSKYDIKEGTVILILMDTLLAKDSWGGLGRRGFLRLFKESVEKVMVNREPICLHLLIRLCFL